MKWAQILALVFGVLEKPASTITSTELRALALAAIELGKNVDDLVAVFRTAGVPAEVLADADLENTRTIYDRIEEMRNEN